MTSNSDDTTDKPISQNPAELFFDARLSRLEDNMAEQQKSMVTVEGKLDNISQMVTQMSSQAGQNNLLQKLLMGSIVVQSLLHGITTPEAAKQAISQIFGGS